MSSTLPSAAISGAGTAYIDIPAAEPDEAVRTLVLLHGVGLDHTMWARQIEAFRQSWRVIAPDMLGHGASIGPPADATLETYADQIAGLVAQLGIERAVLVGFSMGALVARAIALSRPAWLTGLVLLNGVFDRDDDARAAIDARVAEVELGGPAANADTALQRWFSPEYRREHPGEIARLRDRLAANDPQGYLTTYRLFAGEDNFGSDRLAAIAVPTLVATGEFDTGSTPAMTRGLAARIAGARAEIIPGARHMMSIECAAETAGLLRRFFDDNCRIAYRAADLANEVHPQ